MFKWMSIIGMLVFFSWGNAQNWYREAQRNERMLRPGLGFQAIEGQGIVFQLNRGHFCHNSYFPYFIIEAALTRENSFHFISTKNYLNGKWSHGGLQYSATFLYSFWKLDNWKHVVFAFMLGAGWEQGKRPWQIPLTDMHLLENYMGYNLLARLNINGPTIKFSNHHRSFMTNVSLFIGAKYHKEWDTSFHYLRPNAGILFNLLFPKKIGG
ncbi:MAG: hypothetical protein KatS3mg035_0289 [Bacteroidia bacterium]|nr:MAG: hypothetical protein KatS3mg035_0289 [Bacteroidia bacterium]